MEKRFVLSKEEFAEKRVDAVHEALGEVMRNHAEVKGVTLFGSVTKGKLKPESDIDMYVFVNPDEVEDESEEGILRVTAEENPPVFVSAVMEKYHGIILDAVQARADLSHHQLKDVRVLPLSHEIIHEQVGYLYAAHEEGRPLIPPTIFYALFHLGIGLGVENYRSELVHILKHLGKAGEDIWEAIINLTAHVERDNAEEIHYPRTLEAAERVYCHGSTS